MEDDVWIAPDTVAQLEQVLGGVKDIKWDVLVIGNRSLWGPVSFVKEVIFSMAF
jgi:hypothetical protein